MIPYNPSSFNTNKTILEQILELKNWLKAHPSYEIFYCTANFMPYQDVDYAFTEIAGGRAEEIEVGDLLVFPDAYYSQVIAVDHDTEFVTIALPATSFKGPQGATGPTGVSVATANIYPDGHLYLTLSDGTLIDTGIAKGADGTNGTDGAYVSSASVDASGDLQITIYDPATSTSSVVNAGHVVGADGQGIQIIDVTTTTGTLSASDLAKVTGTDDCTINYTSVNGTISFKRLFWDSAYAYFTGVYVDTDTYYCVTEVEIASGAFSIDINPLPIKDSNIDSGSATNGQVLTANGSGGASWSTISSGANVFEVASTSGYVTASDLVKCASEDCILIYDKKFYFRDRNHDTYYYFSPIISGNTDITSCLRFQVQKVGGSYTSTTINHKLDGTKITSGGATNGQVLTADGSGNATWQNASGTFDDYVIITTTSGTLSQDNINKLLKNDSVIIYQSGTNYSFYIKHFEDNTTLRFVRYNDNLIYTISITKSSGAYSRTLGSISGAGLSSSGASSGQVLMADGNGSSSWQNAGGVEVVQFNDVSSSGTFTGDDLTKIASGDVILFGTQYFRLYRCVYKNTIGNSVTYICYKNLYSVLRTYILDVNTSTGAWTLTDITTRDKQTASNINSETATNGQVLTANGSGGASWQNASGGSTLYQHNIIMYASGSYQISLTIINDQSTAFANFSELKTWLYNKGYNSGSSVYTNITGGAIANSKTNLVESISATGASAMVLYVRDMTSATLSSTSINITSGTISDKVVAL